MRIAFLAPAGAMHRYNGNFGHTLHYAPLTLTTLAGLVPEDLGAELVLYDESVDPIPLDLSADLVCVTVITGTAPRCYRYADYFRSRGLKVVLGGVHVSMLPDEAARHADAIVTGFAEFSFPRMLRDLAAGRLQPRYDQGPDFTLKGRPLPRRDLLKRWGYITTRTLEAVRGCSFPCTFCAWPAAFGRKVYLRPVREVTAEIEAMGGTLLTFPDINLLADRAYALELFRALVPLKKRWLGLATSSVGLDDEMLTLLERSGCQGLLIGFESITQGSQAFVNKGVNKVAEYADLMSRLHNHGILVQGCFAFGGDDEDPSVFDRTIEMVTRTRIDLPRYSILTPFPRTKLYADLEAQGRIFERDWAMYDVEHCVFQPQHMTVAQLEEGITWAWESTYGVGNIARRLWPFALNPWLGLPVNLGYRTYARKYRRFTRPVMVDDFDIPAVGT